MKTGGCRFGRPGRMLTIGANRADSHASYSQGTTDGITQNIRASLLRLPGELDRRGRLLPIGERYAGQTKATPPSKARRQQGSAGRGACLAARQKSRSEGWKVSTCAGVYSGPG